MTHPMNMTLYRLLLKTGASEPDAEAAAQVDKADLVTNLELAMAQLKVDLQRVILQAMVGMTAIFAIIVGLFRVFA